MAEKYCVDCFANFREEDLFCSKCGKELQNNILDTKIEVEMFGHFICNLWQKDKPTCLELVDLSKMVSPGSRFMDRLIAHFFKFNAEKEKYKDFKTYFRCNFTQNKTKGENNESKLLTYSDYKDFIEESCIETYDKEKKTVKMPLRQVLFYLTEIYLSRKDDYEKVTLPIKLSIEAKSENGTKINKPLEDLKGKFLYQHPVNRTLHTQSEIEDILKPELNDISKPYKLTQLYVHYMDFVGISIFIPSDLLIDLTELFIKKRLLLEKYPNFTPNDISKMSGLSFT